MRKDTRKPYLKRIITGTVLDENEQARTQADYFGYKGINFFQPYQSMYDTDGTPIGMEAAVWLDEPSLSDSSLGLKSEADKPAWKQFLCQNFCDLYGISGIPRFILVKRDGKIIEPNAPRPSATDIISFIEEHVK